VFRAHAGVVAAPWSFMANVVPSKRDFIGLRHDCHQRAPQFEDLAVSSARTVCRQGRGRLAFTCPIQIEMPASLGARGMRLFPFHVPVHGKNPCGYPQKK